MIGKQRIGLRRGGQMVNWYKKAAKEPEFKPYDIFKTDSIKKERIPSVWEEDEIKARTKALQDYFYLKEYVSMCRARNQDCDIKAILDKGKWLRIQNDKEEKIQNAWWNK